MKLKKLLLGFGLAAVFFTAIMIVMACIPFAASTPYKSQNFAPDNSELIRRKELCIELIQSNIKVSIAERKLQQK